MSFLLTFILTFLLISLAFVLFIKFSPPVYRLEKKNLLILLTLVVEGQATENDWEVFLGLPIRHNDELEAVRLHCCDISEREYIGGSGCLLTKKGIEEVKQILTELAGAEE